MAEAKSKKKSKRPAWVKPRPLNGLPSLDALPRDEFLAATKHFFSTLTKPIIDSRTPKTGGREFAASYTRMVDTIVGILFQRAAERHHLSTDETGIAVIGMGGYGRTELAPYSDIDVLVICRKKTKKVEAVAGSFIRLMWDFGFELGHAVESLVESETALTQHMDTKTALIESRWVCGSARAARAVERQVARIRSNDREEYLRTKIEDALVRYAKYGRSFQLIEPNVKESPGGIRDFQTLVWIGQVGRKARGLGALRQKGLLLAGEQGELEQAYDFLLRVRTELHLLTKSKQDQLTVADQKRVARVLGYRSRDGHLDVEKFMRDYYTHTRAIFRITDDVIGEMGRGANVGVMLGKSRIHLDRETLNVPIRRESIKKDPLRIFRAQQQTGQKLARSLRRRLEVVLREHLKGREILARMRRDFAALVESDHNVDLVVRSLHGTQFLMRIIPEYEKLTCLKRYDLYHHFTVDEHSFKVLENIAALGRPDANPADPLVRLYSEISDKRPLILVALLHDVGKIEGRGHAKKGAVLARKILKRLSLPEEEIELVCFLIRHHLLMSHFSQRRDPSDIGTIRTFCDTVIDRTRLKHLCLITYADYKATSPLVWNEWKATLLWELYIRAYDFMAKREKEPEAVYKGHKVRLLESFIDGPARDSALAHLDLLPGTYLLTSTPKMVRDHMAMVEAIEKERFAIDIDLEGSAYRITFCTHDQPYRLSQLCGALTLSDFSILYAHAFTRRDGKVIDVFDIEDMSPSEDPASVVQRLDKMRSRLGDIFDGTINLDKATQAHAKKWRRVHRRGIPRATKVQFENDLSIDHTIIDVFAPDRPGLLYRITHALSSQNLVIFRAKISTEADRAIDSFYVAGGDGGKVTSPTRLQRIRRALERAIE